jgi:hypothetical protein
VTTGSGTHQRRHSALRTRMYANIKPQSQPKHSFTQITGKRVSGNANARNAKREQNASTFNFGTRFMLQSYPQNKIARLSQFHKTQTETHIALELLVSPGIQ